MEQSTLLWSPSPERMEAALIDDFMQFAEDRSGHNLKNYPELYQWSIENTELFWSAVWDFAKVIGEKGLRILVNGEDIERAKWFPDAQLNFAENLLRLPASGKDAIVIEFKAEDKIRSSLTYSQLYEQVSSVANWLQAQGVVKGDRVAGYLPNMPETIVAMLATASLGGIWTSTSPDFGEDSVIQHFGGSLPPMAISTMASRLIFAPKWRWSS
ncbi:MAG TPA: AMP-binding protein [Thiolinea sp.]|nr:AMP-binding protein [Thiolinea sp.]